MVPPFLLYVRNMKKKLYLILIPLFVGMIIGCSKDDTDNPNKPSHEESEPTTESETIENDPNQIIVTGGIENVALGYDGDDSKYSVVIYGYANLPKEMIPLMGYGLSFGIEVSRASSFANSTRYQAASTDSNNKFKVTLPGRGSERLYWRAYLDAGDYSQYAKENSFTLPDWENMVKEVVITSGSAKKISFCTAVISQTDSRNKIMYSTNQSELTKNNKLDSYNYNGGYSLMGLIPNTIYYYREYRMYGSSMALGDVKSFTTGSDDIVSMSITNVSYGSVNISVDDSFKKDIANYLGYSLQLSKSGEFKNNDILTNSRLSLNSKYYCRLAIEAKNDKGESVIVYTGKPMTFTTKSLPSSYLNANTVDMGDGLEWATRNWGASTPMEMGTVFVGASYMGSNATVTGVGDGWRIPTSKEFEILMSVGDYEKGTEVDPMNHGGIEYTNEGMVVTSRNGNILFFPEDYYNTGYFCTNKSRYWPYYDVLYGTGIYFNIDPLIPQEEWKFYVRAVKTK